MNPRFSIIPAGAVTDPRIEPRDLQVLCLLGRHIDDLGWCRRSQVRMAKELRCARSTVQASLNRLIAADWVERRQEPSGSQGQTAHSYRVRLDVDDRDSFYRDGRRSSDSEETEQPEEPKTPPAPPADRSAPLPPQDRHPLPIHGSAPIVLTTPVERTADDAHAQACLPSASQPDISPDQEAAMREAAGACLNAASPGLLVMAAPLRWLAAGVDFRLDVLPALRAAAARSPPGKVRSWEYFTGAVAEAHAARTRPMPDPPPPGNPDPRGPDARTPRPRSTAQLAIALAREAREHERGGGGDRPAPLGLPGPG